MIRIQDIIKEIEEWAPPGVAWERDNVGLQIGNPSEEVRGVLVALEVTADVIAEALSRKCNLIITHHPLLFNPLKNITPRSLTGDLALTVARNGLHVYSAHTNIDFTRDGVNFVLATKLKLQDCMFLHQESGSLKKISVFVPTAYVEKVTNAMTEAGAGIIGEYEACSFQSSGTGTFRPRPGAQPFNGTVGQLEHADEVRIEMVVPSWKTAAVVAAMTEAHPYEEVAHDIYTNEAIDPMYGAGVIGMLEAPLRPKEFIQHIKDALHIPAVRWTRGASESIYRVAVCGGSGSELLPVALRKKADAFVTADIKYHTFHEAFGRIYLVDAGHYETEIYITNAIVHRLQNKFQDSAIPLYKTSSITNPVNYT
jgi:dinuclear metal center YbgI/SA1388 family protein